MNFDEPRPSLDWDVPAVEWELTKDRVHSEWGETGGYLGREVDLAMSEWVDRDEYAEIENQLDRLVKAAGRRPTDVFLEKNPDLADTLDAVESLDSLAEQDKDRVGVRVHAETAQTLKAVAQENGNDPGVELARALRARRLGGRATRIERKLERIVDDAEELLAELDDDQDGGGMGVVEKRTLRICRRLDDDPPIYEREDIRDAIRQEGLESAPTVDDYEERVIDRLGLVPFPSNYERLLPESKFATFARVDPDAPAIDRLPWEALDREQKVEGILIELARKAEGGGRAGLLVKNVSDKVFDGNRSDSHVRDLVNEAAEREGYWCSESRSGKQTIEVNLSDVVDSDVLDAVDESAETSHAPTTGDGGTVATDGGRGTQ